MAWDQFLQPLAHAAPARLGGAAVDDHRQRVDRFLVDQNRHLHEVALAIADLVIIEAGIALRQRLQSIVEIEHDLVERQFIGRLRAAADIGQVLLDTAPVLAQLQDAAQIFVGDIDGRLDPRLADRLDLVGIGHVGRVVQVDLPAAMGQLDLIHHRRRGGDQVEIIFAGQPLLDDLQMQQPQETATETEAQRRRGFHLEAERGIVQPQLADRLAQLLEVVGIDREQAAEHHRLDFLKARQRLLGRLLGVGQRVAYPRLRHVLDLRGDEADLAGAEVGQLLDLGAEAADAVHQMLRAGLHEGHLLALLQRPVDHAHQDDDAEIRIVP